MRLQATRLARDGTKQTPEAELQACSRISSPSTVPRTACMRRRSSRTYSHVQDRSGVSHLPSITNRQGVIASLQLKLFKGKLDDLNTRYKTVT